MNVNHSCCMVQKRTSAQISVILEQHQLLLGLEYNFVTRTKKQNRYNSDIFSENIDLTLLEHKCRAGM